MKKNSTTKSGLSQRVVCRGIPYFIEILHAKGQEDWTVEVINTVGKKSVWKNAAKDDVLALMDAITHIHGLHPEAAYRA